jgi:hypothetical protein
MELDGTASPGRPYGPAFSTPYSERITAARSSHNSAALNDQPTHGIQKTTTSEALKAYLFASPKQSSHPSPSASPFGANGLASSGMSSVHAPKTVGRTSSGLRQEVTPTKTPTKTPASNFNRSTSNTPSRVYGHPSDSNDFISTFSQSTAPPIPAPNYGAPSENSSGDLKNMEDSLRRMLNLVSVGSSGASGQILDHAPTTAVPVPNYAGEGAPPLNGMHNGVMRS